MHALVHRLATDALHLIAPALCPACDTPLAAQERCYCGACRASLDPAPFPREIFAEIGANFPGEELALSAVGALYTFHDDSPVQRLIHALKYRGCYDLGVELGGELGRALTMFREFEDVDLVVPVPLHRARLRERGYNQAEAIGRGIAASIPGSHPLEALARARHTISQTTLGAGARKKNVLEAFQAAGSEIRGKIILLCDDVCTTGATLNACAERLLTAGARRVMAATVARDIARVQKPDIAGLIPGGMGW